LCLSESVQLNPFGNALFSAAKVAYKLMQRAERTHPPAKESAEYYRQDNRQKRP